LSLGIGPRERVILGANVGRPIVTNGEFAAVWCSAMSGSATRGGDAACSQITLGNLVIFIDELRDHVTYFAVIINIRVRIREG